MIRIGECKKCREIKKLTRGYCSSKCYSYLMRHNLLQKIPKIQSPVVFTQMQQEILTGSLLGDGCIFKHPTGRYPYLQIARKLTDIEYLKYEFDFFKEFCNQVEIKRSTISVNSRHAPQKFSSSITSNGMMVKISNSRQQDEHQYCQRQRKLFYWNRR